MWWFVLLVCVAVLLTVQFVVFPASLPKVLDDPFLSSPQASSSTGTTPSKPLLTGDDIIPSDAQLFRAFGGEAHPSSPLAQSEVFRDFISRIDRNSNTFRCNSDGEEKARCIPLSYVNDDVCDCGMDEPGTSACSGHVDAWTPSFACRGKPILTKRRTRMAGAATTAITADGGGGLRGSRDVTKKNKEEEGEEEEEEEQEEVEEEVVIWLPVSRVNDGVCDCPCDGADEWKGRVECPRQAARCIKMV